MKKEKDKPNNSDGGIPTSVLNQINEHTVGGFIVFYFNQNTGRPEQMMSFDSPAHSLALQKYIADWEEAVHQVNLENSIVNIQARLDQIDEDSGKNNGKDEDEE